jgi:BirA family biotin operon repressor/biotin-[acetyl-CoA-carboxylase] ligase
VQIQQGLQTRRIGRQVVVLDEATSTNDAALQAIGGPSPDGLAVFAEYQTAGRGRLGRTWHSPRSASVLCSVLLIEPVDDAQRPIDPGMLTLTAGLATCTAITTAAADVEATLRWPNDVTVGGRKLAGILIESRAHPPGLAYAIGIGINCLQQPAHFEQSVRDRATSLEAESRDPISRLTVARHLIIELDRWLGSQPDLESVRQAWLDRAEPLGQHVRLRQTGHDYIGRTIDVDPTAGLVVELDGGGRRVFDPTTTRLIPGGGGLRSRR